MSKRSVIVSAFLMVCLLCCISEADVLSPGIYRTVSDAKFELRPSERSQNTIDLMIVALSSGKYSCSLFLIDGGKLKDVKSSKGSLNTSVVTESFTYTRPQKGKVIRYRLEASFTPDGQEETGPETAFRNRQRNRYNRLVKNITVSNVNNVIYVFVEEL